ncbi:MBOAT family protein [candidate division WWE3 bacterium]|uniref:MBOAT family protein n=1 Tax=candidate division WWE3 bacterium TaxID=2053526 RepID=A0A955ECA4_UNCKA|nr:MBOAT family protein [candidate division WWE3 bacterium]
MVFSSSTFLFLFFPIVLYIYVLLPFKYKNAWLLSASLVFYYWGEQNYTLVMISSIVLNYIAARLIGQKGKFTNVILLGTIAANLAILVFFKYTGFLLTNLNEIVNVPPRLLNYSLKIPLVAGISFYTFQAISYLFDVKNGLKPKKDITIVALYISMFPQLIAGPIVRYSDVEAQLTTRWTSLDKFIMGIERFIVGLAKKVLIADTIASIVDPIFSVNPATLSPTYAWIGIVGYAIQIYFDFSGYSDMAIGLGHMFGFTFLENFNYPYISKTVTEFWRRWHISLSSWFRDYLYIPLGGNRKGIVRTYINLLTVFILCGLWHGASWNFLVWGLWHGGFLVIEKMGLLKILEKTPKVVRHIYTMLVVLIGWVFFRAETLTDAIQYIKALFTIKTSTQFFYLSSEIYLALILGVLFSTPIIHYFNAKSPLILKYAVLLVTFFITIIYVASSTYSPFIYYRF